MDFYGVYRDARNASWECLIEFNITVLPVDLLAMARIANIRIIQNSSVHLLSDKESGLSFLDGDTFQLIYDDTSVIGRKMFTIAHEFGHIFLGHIIKDGMFRSRANTGELNHNTHDPEERAADMFAVRLLAPAIVLHELKLFTPEQIMEICGISYTAATYRAKRMKELEFRQMYKSHPFERKVLEQFQPFIQEYKKTH